MPEFETCSPCGGMGETTSGRTCRECRGRGEVLVEPSDDFMEPDEPQTDEAAEWGGVDL